MDRLTPISIIKQAKLRELEIIESIIFQPHIVFLATYDAAINLILVIPTEAGIHKNIQRIAITG
jgi:hypothetical protein